MIANALIKRNFDMKFCFLANGLSMPSFKIHRDKMLPRVINLTIKMPNSLNHLSRETAMKMAT